MAKYHLNRATGKASKCAATVRACPLGGFESHFESQEAAELFYQMIAVSEQAGPSLESPEAFANASRRFVELQESGDWEGLQAFVKSRASDADYVSALARRKELQEELDKIAELMEEPKRKSALVNPVIANEGAMELRDLTLAYRDVYEDLAYNNALMTEYRTLTARAAFAASTLRENQERAEGRFLQFDEESLGDLEAMGSYPINSPEWHAARAAGIGGSDVGAIMRVDGAYASQNFTRVLASKLGEPVEDSFSSENKNDLTTAIGRGNAWEEHIRYMVQDNNPDMNVAFCKTSWHGAGETSYRHANFDGLFLDKDGIPEGILEIKTGSNPKKWGDPKDGLDAVPAGYRKQTLWYAANAGLKYGKIVAVLDDNDYREYSFDMNDPAIQAEVKEMYAATDKFWVETQEKKAAKESGLAATHRKTNVFGGKDSLDTVADVYSGYSGESKAEAKQKLAAAIAEAQGPEKRELTSSEFQSTVYKVFSQHNPETRTRPLVGIDIETTTTSPRTGRIIETGIVELNSSSGESKIVYNELHGVPEKAMVGIGPGAVDIHHITADRLVGKTGFDNPETQKEILAKLKNSTMVAHNAGYEDRWLSANLPGYLEAKAKGEINILDTRKVAKYLMPRSNDNSLQSFAEDNGVPYEGAHAAGQDALMMMQGLSRLQKTIHSRDRFITQRPSASTRKNAAESVQHRDGE